MARTTKRDGHLMALAAYAAAVGAALSALALAGSRAESAARKRAKARSAGDGPQPPVLAPGSNRLFPRPGATITVHADRPGVPAATVDAEVLRLLDARWYDVERIASPPDRPPGPGARHYRITHAGIDAGLALELGPGVRVYAP